MATNKEDKWQNLISRIIGGLATPTDLSQGHSKASTNECEDRRNALYFRLEAKGKAVIPPGHHQTLN